ncbi:MAG: enoyl-CoA hydratase/isomerase family protein [Halobacteria archaeon]|nr:enoyl-CoA hydratase/isomerase family protein [Halobacteria archaeon]
MSELSSDELSNEDFDVGVSDDEFVIRATIDRADKRNALNENVMQGINNVLDTADDSEVRVVVIRGAGGTFCSGGDLTEMARLIDASPQEYREYLSSISTLMAKMRRTDALVVAAVEGYCLAGGMGIATASDFVVAADDATFGTPEKDIGLFPMQVMAPIMRAVHEKKGLKMLFTGEKFGADEAEKIGLITDAVPADDFDDELDSFVNNLVNSSPTMISMGKEAYYHQAEMSFDDSLSYLKEMFSLLVMSDDTEEGINAKMMGENPDWKARSGENKQE